MEAISNKFIIISILFVVSVSIIFISNKSSDNIILDEVKLKDNEVSKKQFAVYIRDSKDAEYQEYNEDNLFPVEYKLDLEQSGCVDSNGEKVTTDGIITQTADNKITLKSNKTVYCYLYFEKNSFNGTGSDLAKSESKGLIKTSDDTDLAYRYVGTKEDVENYICFGTTTKNDCTSEDSNYLYRIIGITEQGNLKIIKNSSIGSNKWHTNYTNNAVWDTGSNKIESELHQKLNGSTFLTSSSTQYIPSGWESKIETTSWKMGDSKTTSDSDGDGIGYGTGKTDTGANVWTWESASTATTPSKIGLMYLSDYYYSYDGKGDKNCYDDSGAYATCKSSWLHISNNGDNSTTSSSEWTMSRYGVTSARYYRAWLVNPDNGRSYWNNLNSAYAVRPVFYLKSEVTISGGEGTLNSPYIIN